MNAYWFHLEFTFRFGESLHVLNILQYTLCVCPIVNGMVVGSIPNREIKYILIIRIFLLC